MKDSKALRVWTFGTLLFTTVLAAPALAQTAKVHRAPDANGVDLIHGDYLMSVLEGSIGSGSAELQLIRNGVWVGGGVDLNGHQWDRIEFRKTPVGGGFSYAVTVGPRSEVFTSLGTLPSGSSLTGDANSYVYRTADGTAIAFTDNGHGGWGTASNFCTGWPGQGSCTLIPTAISEPNGKTVALGWEVWTYCWGMIDSETLPCNFTPRIGSVSNSFGYSIRFAYASGGEGGGGTSPPSSWRQRTGAAFHNAEVSGDPSQANVSYSYPSTGVTQVTDMSGLVWRFTGTILGVTGIRRPGAGSDTTTVSYSGAVVTSMVNEGVTTAYSRSVSGSTATTTVTAVDGDAGTTDPVTTAVSNLTTGRLTSVTDPLSRQIQFQYDGNNRLTRVTQPEGNYVQYTYDARGNVTEVRQVAKPGSGLADIVQSASFVSTCSNVVTCNQPNSTTDARGNVTDYTYDATHGGVLTVTAPAPSSGATRPQTRYAYTLTNGEYLSTAISTCASGTAPGCVGTASESVSTIAHDANGNVTSTTVADGTGTLAAAEARTYDALGNLLTVDGPLAGGADTVRYRYNAGRRPIGLVSPDPDGAGGLKPRAARATYSGSTGLLTRIERGTVNSQSDGDWASFASLQEAQQDYDANGRPVVRRLVSGGTTYALTQTSYDALGRAECTAQRLNPNEFATSSLPASACSLDSEGSYGPDRIVRTTYDNGNRATLVQTGYGVTGVAADEVATAYTTNGQAATVTDANGNRTTYEYDGLDRLVKTRMPSPSTPGTSSTGDYEQLTYNSDGSVSRRARSGETIVYHSDALNRLIAKVVPERSTGAQALTTAQTRDVHYGYDLRNQPLFARFDSVSGEGITNTYDGLGRLTSSSTNMGGTTRALAYQYDAAGNRTRITHPDSAYFSSDHDGLGRPAAIWENGATNMSGFTYYAHGAVSGLSRANGTATGYGYDAVQRLSGMVQYLAGTTYDATWNYGYSPASQIASVARDNNAYAWTGHYATTRAYTANGLNQYSAAGGTSLGYDANGNLTASGSSNYVYDVENRLVGAPGGVVLSYDPLGRLHQVSSTAGPTTQFLYDGQALIGEYVSGAMTRRYVHGVGADVPLLSYAGSNLSAPSYLHADERGSIVAISDASGNGTVNRYDEYGIPASTNTGRFQYTGQIWLAELGMSYYKARIYSPTLGRFMQTDPIGYAGGMNLHAYVLNDPINFRDPTGLCHYVDVGYSWYTPGGEYLGPAPGVYFVPKDCDGGFGWGSPGSSGPTLFDAGVGPAGGNGTPDQCSTSAPNSQFREQGRTRVGPIGYGVINLTPGTTDVRVVGIPGLPNSVGPGNVLQQMLQVMTSVSLFFTESNGIPMQIIEQHDMVLSRGGNATMRQYDVPSGSRNMFVVGTQTTAPRTDVIVFGCQQ